MFQALDCDGDGKLTKEDLESVCDHRFGASLGDVFSSCDLNQNGFIDYTEFLTATYDWHQNIREEWAKRAFKFINTSNSGVLTAEELKEFINDQCSEEDWENLFNPADVDEDGCLHWEAFKHLLRI